MQHPISHIIQTNTSHHNTNSGAHSANVGNNHFHEGPTGDVHTEIGKIIQDNNVHHNTTDTLNVAGYMINNNQTYHIHISPPQHFNAIHPPIAQNNDGNNNNNQQLFYAHTPEPLYPFIPSLTNNTFSPYSPPSPSYPDDLDCNVQTKQTTEMPQKLLFVQATKPSNHRKRKYNHSAMPSQRTTKRRKYGHGNDDNLYHKNRKIANKSNKKQMINMNYYQISPMQHKYKMSPDGDRLTVPMHTNHVGHTTNYHHTNNVGLPYQYTPHSNKDDMDSFDEKEEEEQDLMTSTNNSSLHCPMPVYADSEKMEYKQQTNTTHTNITQSTLRNAPNHHEECLMLKGINGSAPTLVPLRSGSSKENVSISLSRNYHKNSDFDKSKMSYSKKQSMH